MPAPKLRPTQISREIIKIQRPSLDVESSAFQHAPEAATSAEPLLLEGLPADATVPDLELLQVIVGNIVRQRRQALEAADEAHFAALSRLNHLRLVRDDVKGRLLPQLTDIRDTFDAAFGVNTCQRILGIGSRIPEDALTVRRLGERVISRLDAPDFQLPPARSEGVAVNSKQWVIELTPDVDSLRETLVSLSEAKRQADLTLEAKEAEIDSFSSIYGRGSRLLEAIYDFAGREHLAERLRPTSRRPRPAGDSDDPGDDTPPQSTEGETPPEDTPPDPQEPPPVDEPADPPADPPPST